VADGDRPDRAKWRGCGIRPYAFTRSTGNAGTARNPRGYGAFCTIDVAAPPHSPVPRNGVNTYAINAGSFCRPICLSIPPQRFAPRSLDKDEQQSPNGDVDFIEQGASAEEEGVVRRVGAYQQSETVRFDRRIVRREESIVSTIRGLPHPQIHRPANICGRIGYGVYVLRMTRLA
jgi:hypothetical protein